MGVPVPEVSLIALSALEVSFYRRLLILGVWDDVLPEIDGSLDLD